MKIITINANGIRAAARKGVFEWLAEQGADVVCIQETKAQVAQLSDPIFHPEGYHCYYHDAEKKATAAWLCIVDTSRMTSLRGWALMSWIAKAVIWKRAMAS